MSKNKKRKKRLKLQARLLDILLHMQEEAERRDEIHNLNRLIRNFQGTLSFTTKKMKRYYWNDMLVGYRALLQNAERKDEMENIAKLVKLTEKIFNL